MSEERRTTPTRRFIRGVRVALGTETLVSEGLGGRSELIFHPDPFRPIRSNKSLFGDPPLELTNQPSQSDQL